MLSHVLTHRAIDTFGSSSQREFAQRRQISGIEEIGKRPLSDFLRIDLPVPKALLKLFRCDVHNLDLVGQVENAVRHSFTNLDVRDLGDDIVRARKMLHIHG